MRTLSSLFVVQSRKSKRLARFIPAFESLEARLTPSGDPLVQPQVLASVNGVLNVTLTEQVGPVKIGDHIVQDAWTYNGMYPGPTLQLNPGDTLNVTLVNKLPVATNLHTHGLHVSPIGASDNILLNIEPGETFQYHVVIPANHPEGLYWYHPHVHGEVNLSESRGLSGMIVIGRPDGGYPQLNGLNQLIMATNAAPIVENTNQPGIVPGQFFMKDTNMLDPALQTYTTNGQINPSITMRPNDYQVVSLLDNSAQAFYTAGFEDIDPKTGLPIDATTTTAASSDGVISKTATTINVASTTGFTSSGEIRVITTGAGPTLYHYTGITPTSFTGLAVQGKDFGGKLMTGGSVTQVTVHMWPVAIDGNPFTSVGNPGDASEPELIAWTPARRWSFIIGGFQAGHTYVFQNVGYRNPTPNTNPPQGDMGDGTNVWPPFAMFTVNVAGTPVTGPTPSYIPVFDPVTKVYTKPTLSPPNNYFHDLSAPGVVVAQKRTVEFDQSVGEFSMMIDGINGAQFPDNVVFQPRLGTVEEWTLVNNTDDDHPFHLHTNAFQSVGPGQGPAFDKPAGLKGFWLDTLNVPRHTTQTIRIDFEDYLGEMVYHCHRVDHEDTGMMAAVQILPAQSIIATGVGPGSLPPGASEVNVYNGDTKALLKQLNPFPGFTGGINVAVGDVNGDAISDVICTAGAGGGPSVMVFSGKDYSVLYNFFAFDAAFVGGVNVAAADINLDGLDDIIVGAGAGGGPQVRVFSGATGAPILTFFAFDPAFVGGVTVASGDLIGNGRFQIITGAGAGGGPNVSIFDGQATMLSSFFAFDPAFIGGVNVGTGRVRGIGFASVICGAGAGAGPAVTAFQAAESHTMMDSSTHMLDFSQIANFLAFDPSFAGGVSVGSLNKTLGTNFLVGAGKGGGPAVSTFDGVTHNQLDTFFAQSPTFTGGVNVAAN